ncbi:MAG: uroporphyrinogen decarboxylase family protein, partial [Eubacteriales bacterium]
KWAYENVKSDHHQFFITPLFAYVSEAETFGCEVEYRKNDIPWVKGHCINTHDDLDKLEKLDFIHSGAHGREVRYREDMLKIAGNYKIRFNDGKEIGIQDKIKLGLYNYSYSYGNPGVGVAGATIGTMLNANDIRGLENIMMDMLDDPEFAHRLLSIITDKIIAWVTYTKEVCGEPKEGVFIGDDGAANLSPALYEEFLLPYQKKIQAAFGGYTSFHGDAKAHHIFPYLANELKINDFSGFSYLDDAELVKEYFCGKTVLCGNVNPMAMETGDPESVMQMAKIAIENYAPYSGYFLKDGDNITPKTPLENVNALYEAAVKYGKY